MARTLQEVQADIDARAAAATPGTQTEAIYELLSELVVALVLLNNKDNAPADCDSKVAALNSTINNQAKILQATKEALHIPDNKTMNQMPEEAEKIYGDAQKWKGSL